MSDIINWVLLQELAVFLDALLPVLGPEIIQAADAVAFALGHAIHMFHGQFGVLLGILELPQVSGNSSLASVGTGEARIEFRSS